MGCSRAVTVFQEPGITSVPCGWVEPRVGYLGSDDLSNSWVAWTSLPVVEMSVTPNDMTLDEDHDLILSGDV